MQRDDVVTDASSIAQPLDAFETFVQEAEPRLRRALIARFGTEAGRDATAEALAYAWEHWGRLYDASNLVGYLGGLNQSSQQARLRGGFS